MALMRINFRGQSIAKQTNMTVILPDGANSDGPFPVLYLLHGLSDDDSTWVRRTSLERYVADMPLIVIMPDTARGFYTDAVEGLAYESHIMRDVMGFADRFFPTIPERRGRAIEGLSMGGYGAMKLALKYPDRFCSVVAHSSAFNVRGLVQSAEHGPELRRIFGGDPAEGGNDVFTLAESIEPAELPAVRFDCGTDDELLEHSRSLHGHLDGLGIGHEYEEFPGAHEWGYWDRRVREGLRFHARELGI